MNWLDLLAYFVGGAFLANTVPHFVAGIMGRAFQSPFAKPPGEGLSSSRVNVLWGFANLVLSYLLTCHVGSFDLRSWPDAVAIGLGMLILAVLMSTHFGRFNGGNLDRP